MTKSREKQKILAKQMLYKKQEAIKERCVWDMCRIVMGKCVRKVFIFFIFDEDRNCRNLNRSNRKH